MELPGQPPAAATWPIMGRFAAAFLDVPAPRIGFAIFLVALGALLEGFGLMLLAPVLALALSAGSVPWLQNAVASLLADLGAETQREKLLLLLALFITLMVARAVVLLARDVTLATLQTGFVERRRAELIRHLARASWEKVSTLHHARVSNAVGVELQRLATTTHFMIQGLTAVIVLAIQAILAFALAPGMALAAGTMLLAAASVLAIRPGRSIDIGRAVGQGGLALAGDTATLLSGLKTAGAQNVGAAFQAEFSAVQAALRERQLDFVRRQAGNRTIFAIVSALGGVIAVWVGWDLIGTPPAVLIILILLFTRMSGPAMTIVQSLQQTLFGLPAFEALEALTRELAVSAQPVGDVAVPPPGSIRLDDVSYLHPDGGGIVSVGLVIAPGEFVGLSGPSGAGKTTLVDVVCGLLPPQSGVVTIGGLVLDPPLAAGWRGQLGYVAQDAFLFHDTVRRNLVWGGPDPGDDDIWQALETVEAAALVRGLPAGLDTVIGERGQRLSGGERQRIAIARALLRAPRLLILDEATNALDLAAEAAVLDRLAATSPRPSILMVAHRPESLARCDRVVRIEDRRQAGESHSA